MHEQNKHRGKRDGDPFASGAHGASEEESALKIAFFAGLFALPVSLGIGLALLLALSFAAYSNPDPDKLIAPLGITALILTSVLCGFVSARRGGRAAALCGLMGGGLFALALFAISLCFGDEARAALTLGATGGVSLLLHAGVVALALVGATLSNALKNAKESKPKHRYRAG
ncbi:MAG: TIGR04086 family membrane protein [Ruminococcaceae bacterium]|nr:TIGR04086 family membrane protein [Oscillospiraceae bacterium]